MVMNFKVIKRRSFTLRNKYTEICNSIQRIHFGHFNFIFSEILLLKSGKNSNIRSCEFMDISISY